MKQLFFLIITLLTLGCKAQIYPLRSYFPKPENSYLKDTNNELQDYVGTWKVVWNGKITYIYITKLTHKYEAFLKEYRDVLIAKYKVTDLNGNILFDNSNSSDGDAVLEGTRFRKQDDKYFMIYSDGDMCGRWGDVLINFTNTAKTELQWKYMPSEQFIDTDCWYYNSAPAQRPQPLPKIAILIKQ